MTCKDDCIHYNVCNYHIDEETPFEVTECNNFKNKADFVEVVRCKDCKYYNPNYSRFESDTPYNRCEHPAQQFDVECYDMWLETNPDDFCSYGTPKERGGEK